MSAVNVTVVTVVYGTRWPLLKQVAEACLSDDKVKTFIIVDNGCADANAMDAYARQHEGRIVILRQPKNIGFSGAIAKGLARAKETACDYVFILDDDSVPEAGAIDHFLANLRFFEGQKVVLVGNRIDVPGNKDIFRRRPLQDAPPRGTLFEVFSLRKLINAIKLLLRIPERTDHPMLPIVPTEAFVTGGTFLPIGAVREAPLPDPSLFIYGEDLEYAWGIRRRGYQSYACVRPVIRDIDMTFPSYGYHIFGLFDSATPEYKVYFRMRNAVIISKRHTTQWPVILLLNVLVWYFGLCIIGLITRGPTRTYFARVALIGRALLTGFIPSIPYPKQVKKPN